MLERLTKRYLDLYRRYLSLNQNNRFQYARTFPGVEIAMRNLAHPVLGPTLRRLFRFEGSGRYTQSHIVPIHQNISYESGRQNVIMPIEKIREVIEDSSYRILMNRCIPDHFWGFRPKIRG